MVLAEEFGAITFCGIQQIGNLIFAGDFCGGISGFDIHTNQRVYYTNVALPIRTLNCLPKKNIVLVGTMDGTIYEWDFLNG